MGSNSIQKRGKACLEKQGTKNVVVVCIIRSALSFCWEVPGQEKRNIIPCFWKKK